MLKRGLCTKFWHSAWKRCGQSALCAECEQCVNKGRLCECCMSRVRIMKVSLEKSEQHVTHVQLGRAGISSGSPAHGRNSGTFSESLD